MLRSRAFGLDLFWCWLVVFLLRAFLSSGLLLGCSCDGLLAPFFSGLGEPFLCFLDLRFVPVDFLDGGSVNLGESGRNVGIFIRSYRFVPSFVDPHLLALFVQLAVDAASQVNYFLDGLLVVRRLVQSLGEGHLLDLRVVEGLAGGLVLNPVPRVIVHLFWDIDAFQVEGLAKENDLDGRVGKII